MNKRIYLMRPFVGAEEFEAVKAVFESKYLIEGLVTAEFGRQFANFVGEKHAIAVTSCMTRLVLALDALGVGKGDEVIVPDFTHPATGDCAYEVGADAVLVDVDRRTYNITPQAIEAAITDKNPILVPLKKSIGKLKSMALSGF